MPSVERMTMKSKTVFGEAFRWSRLVCLAALLSAKPTLAQSPARPAYRSPSDVAYSPDGSLLAVADRTWPGVWILKSSDGSVSQKAQLQGDPYHVIWNGSDKVMVAEGNKGTVAEVEVASGKVLRRIPIGLVAKGLALTKDGRLLVCDRASNTLVIVKLASGTIESTIAVGREPGTVVVTKGNKAMVGNQLPRPSDPLHGTPAAEISIVDLSSKQVTAVPLVRQATQVRQVVLSPDEKWVYVTHQSPRGGLPVTQLDNGWVMTNALSVIDAEKGTLYADFVFDRSGSGGAHPWGAAISKDGNKLWVALEGVREVATVDLTRLHERLSGYTETQRLNNLIVNLSDLHSDGTIKRTVLTDMDGPRGVALSPDGSVLAVAVYYTGKVLQLPTSDLSMSKAVTTTLPDNPAEDKIRMGERYFHSAMNCYQSWLSCSSCHDDGHADGLNWDLQNDGTGNPKQTKSLVFSSETPPVMATGCRESAEVGVRAGFQFIEFQVSPEDRVQAVYAFLRSLAPEPSPFLGPDGQLTPEAVEGKKLFEDQAGCSKCHAGQYFTDMLKHNVGTREDNPASSSTWDVQGYDTPSLIEVWRTAPYLHLGTAVTIQDTILAHVKTPAFSAQQLDQLAAYVKQIGPTRDQARPVPVDAGVPIGDAPSAPSSTAGSSGQATTSAGGAGGSTKATNSGFAGQGGTGASAPSSSGGADATNSDSAGQGGNGASAASSGGSADTRTQDATKLSKGGCSCRMDSRSRSQDGLLLLLLGLAWLVRRARRHPRRETAGRGEWMAGAQRRCQEGRSLSKTVTRR
jgi:MYXO-CTERM domain-containing protein